MTLRRLCNVTYAVLAEGRSQEQRDDLDAALEFGPDDRRTIAIQNRAATMRLQALLPG